MQFNLQNLIWASANSSKCLFDKWLIHSINRIIFSKYFYSPDLKSLIESMIETKNLCKMVFLESLGSLDMGCSNHHHSIIQRNLICIKVLWKFIQELAESYYSMYFTYSVLCLRRQIRWKYLNLFLQLYFLPPSA